MAKSMGMLLAARNARLMLDVGPGMLIRSVWTASPSAISITEMVPNRMRSVRPVIRR